MNQAEEIARVTEKGESGVNNISKQVLDYDLQEEMRNEGRTKSSRRSIVQNAPIKGIKTSSQSEVRNHGP